MHGLLAIASMLFYVPLPDVEFHYESFCAEPFAAVWWHRVLTGPLRRTTLRMEHKYTLLFRLPN